MGDAALQDAWVERVLGVALAAGGDAAAAADLAERLQSAGLALRGLRNAQAPEAAALTARHLELGRIATEDPARAPALLDKLEPDIARAVSAARGRDSGGTAGRGVAYRKMLLRWRQAQQQLDANVKSIGQAVLARPEVKSDPRIADIETAVAGFADLVPQFGGALEDVLDEAMNASDPAELKRLAAGGIAAIDAYRNELAAASGLQALEELANKDLGTGLKLRGALDQALAELRQQIAA